MKKKCILAGVMSALVMLVSIPSQAAFEKETENTYNALLQSQSALEGLDVSLTEKTIASSTNTSSIRNISIKAINTTSAAMKAHISVRTDESTNESYYANGYYYTTTSKGKEKRQMERSDIWNVLNSQLCLNMTSNYLKMLYCESENDNTTVYHFAATEDTLGDYRKLLLNGAADGQGISIDALSGTTAVDSEGNLLKRTLEIMYTVTSGDTIETFILQIDAVFRKTGSDVILNLPDFSDYKEPKSEEKPAETITPSERTIYTTDDVNVRAAGNLTAVILGGLQAGSGVTETGYTSDGWIQIQYNGAPGYIWGEYTSTKKPVLTKSTSGTMYATASVNVREGYSSDSRIIGGLTRGQAVSITGITDNNWIRVIYDGKTAYIYADYLTWSEPIVDTFVKNAVLEGYVKDASYGNLAVRKYDGSIVYFNTVYAVMQLADTIEPGDWVQVQYSGSGSPYTASLVKDQAVHGNSSQEEMITVEGVVDSYGSNTMTLVGSDGILRTFDVSTADFEMSGVPQTGQYVTVTWLSSRGGNETRNIHALRVRG